MVDLDSNKLTPARIEPEIPALPEPEGTILKNHLKQVKFQIYINVASLKNFSFIIAQKNTISINIKCLNVIIFSHHNKHNNFLAIILSTFLMIFIFYT